MNLPIKLKTPTIKERSIIIKIDAKRFERLAAAFGFFSRGFMDSIERAERDLKIGRIRKIKSVKDSEQSFSSFTAYRKTRTERQAVVELSRR